MDSSVTQGTSKLSMIFSATVVLPDALPPQMPEMDERLVVKFLNRSRVRLAHL